MAIRRFALLCSVALSSTVQAQARNAGSFALEHTNVVDVRTGQVLPDQTVIVASGRITRVGRAASVRAPAGARSIDARGKYVIPGLWDMHVHSAYPGIDASFAPLYIANGITGVREMYGNMYSLHAWKKHYANGDTWPRIVGSGHILDGPVPIWPGSARARNAAEGRRAVDSLHAAGADFIKVYNRLPRAAYFAVLAEAKRRGTYVAGHVPDAVTTIEASDSGQRTIEHLTGVTLDCSTRADSLRAARVAANNSPNPLPPAYGRFANRLLETQDPARCAAVIARFARNHTWQVPTLVVQRSMAWLDDSVFTADPRVRYLGKAFAAQWDWRGDFRLRTRTPEDWAAAKRLYKRSVEIVGELQRSGVPIMAGTDVLNPFAFPGFSLHDELALLVEAGLSSAEALRAATLNPAIFLAATDSLGTVEYGKRADLVVLNANPLDNIHNTQNIWSVVLNGRYYDRAELDGLLATAERKANGQ